MRRNNFRKALNHIESRSVDNNIARLNDELKKTGMLSEKMTTSTILPPTETQPYIPPTTSDVPDTSGLTGDNFSQPTYGGDESDSSTWETGWSSNDFFKNPNELNGETDRPILIQPDAPYPYDDGGEGSGIVFGSIAFGISVGVIDSKGSYRQILVGGLIGGTERPTEESRGFGGVYRALSDAEFNYAVAVWNVYSQLYGSDVGSGTIKAWKGYNRFHDFQSGGEFADWTVTPKRVTYGSEILHSFSYFKKSNTYVSDPGQERTIVLNRLEDPSSPDFYEGDFSKYLRDLLNLGKRAFDYLKQKLGLDAELTPAQAAKFATNVAGGTPFNPSFQAYGGSSPGLGGEIKLGQHGTGTDAATKITAPASDLKTQKRGMAGFKPGSRQNVYGRSGVFIDPSQSGAAADEFARAGAAAEKQGRETAARSATQRFKDLRTGSSNQITRTKLKTSGGKMIDPITGLPLKNFGKPAADVGEKIPVAYKPGTGSRMNIPGTKYAEVGIDASKATKGARLAQNAATKYPNSAKAQQLITKGATTAASKGAARTVAKTLGKAVPFAGATISAADAADRISKGDVAGAVLSGLTGVPGPVGWAALATQIVTDNTGLTGGGSRSTSNTSTSGRGAGRKAFAKEEKEYDSYQDYVDRAKEVINKNKIKLDKGLLDVLKTELGLSDKLSDEDKEYLVDIFDNPDNVNPDEMSEFIQRIVSKLSSEGEQVSESVILSEGWQSPDHTNVEKDPKTRWFNPNAGTDSAKWFDPKEVKPVYPAKAPPKMIDGYSATSNLAPKPVDKSPAIKLTKKDLLRNHRLKDSEVAEMMQTIARLNKFIADHPEELIYAQSRYPKHDPRLAELNWKMDQMLNASNEYLDKQFPENERLFNRLKSATQKTIELTDPETYKKDPGKLTSMGNLAKVDSVMNHYVPKDRIVSKIKVEKKKSVNRFFVKPKRPDRPAYLRKKRKDTPS